MGFCDDMLFIVISGTVRSRPGITEMINELYEIGANMFLFSSMQGLIFGGNHCHARRDFVGSWGGLAVKPAM